MNIVIKLIGLKRRYNIIVGYFGCIKVGWCLGDEIVGVSR